MQRSAIVLVIDRLGAAHLGPYGNTLFPTPGFNRLATTAWLCERTITDSPVLEEVYRSWFSGRHVLCPPAALESSLCRRLSALGVESTLFTDDPEVSALAPALGFDHFSELPATPPEEPAEEIAETQMAFFFGELIDEIERLSGSHLLWAHASGLAGPWDAPLELREELVAEDDAPPLETVEPPSGVWVEEEEAEERWPLVCTHAAQIMTLDACLEALLAALPADETEQETLLIVTAPRGYPLGEHGEVGEAATSLHEELVHVPFFVRMPGGAGAAARATILSQPADLTATLLAWFGGELPGGGGSRNLLPSITGQAAANEPAPHQRAVAAREEFAVLHTPLWCWQAELPGSIVEEGAAAEPEGKLFVKPDDRWEVNEVASRCPDIARRMHAELARFAELADAGRLDELPPLPEELA